MNTQTRTYKSSPIFFEYAQEKKDMRRKMGLDYSTFGSPLPGRNYNSSSSAYGFNGKRKDDEITGSTGTDYDFGARVYDARLGKFFSIDAYSLTFSSLSPYEFADNNPIQNIDENGDYVKVKITRYYEDENGTLHVKKWYNVSQKTTRIDKVINIYNAKLYNASSKTYTAKQMERAAEVLQRNIKEAWETKDKEPANGGFVNKDPDDTKTIELNVKVNFVGGVKVVDKKRNLNFRDQKFIIADDAKVNSLDQTGSGDVEAYVQVPFFNTMYIKGSVAQKELGLNQGDDVSASAIAYSDVIAHEFGHEGRLKHRNSGIMKPYSDAGAAPERASGEEKRKIFRK